MSETLEQLPLNLDSPVDSLVIPIISDDPAVQADYEAAFRQVNSEKNRPTPYCVPVGAIVHEWAGSRTINTELRTYEVVIRNGGMATVGRRSSYLPLLHATVKRDKPGASDTLFPLTPIGVLEKDLSQATPEQIAKIRPEYRGFLRLDNSNTQVK